MGNFHSLAYSKKGFGFNLAPYVYHCSDPKKGFLGGAKLNIFTTRLGKIMGFYLNLGRKYGQILRPICP